MEGKKLILERGTIMGYRFKLSNTYVDISYDFLHEDEIGRLLIKYFNTYDSTIVYEKDGELGTEEEHSSGIYYSCIDGNRMKLDSILNSITLDIANLNTRVTKHAYLQDTILQFSYNGSRFICDTVTVSIDKLPPLKGAGWGIELSICSLTDTYIIYNVKEYDMEQFSDNQELESIEYDLVVGINSNIEPRRYKLQCDLKDTSTCLVTTDSSLAIMDMHNFSIIRYICKLNNIYECIECGFETSKGNLYIMSTQLMSKEMLMGYLLSIYYVNLCGNTKEVYKEKKVDSLDFIHKIAEDKKLFNYKIDGFKRMLSKNDIYSVC